MTEQWDKPQQIIVSGTTYSIADNDAFLTAYDIGQGTLIDVVPLNVHALTSA